MEHFISNEQFNMIKSQIIGMQRQANVTSDEGVKTAVKEAAEAKVHDIFQHLTPDQEKLISGIASLETEEERTKFLMDLMPYRTSFPDVTPADLRGLFPKVKKLPVPDLENMDFRALTYLGWKDIGQSKQYFVYVRDGKLKGIQGRYVISAKKGICSLCNRFGDVALTSIQNKPRESEGLKSYGQYICYDSKECNQSIQDSAQLEAFLGQV
ncbi:FusB/FusC family EF-G-binding protein [Jeotgalibacillus haloalkalitolerans]|uniref:FusB/FusC family EF-G-binding protein n=1 Tax=Jeotgalibacillus haloalkalitolerans TaxID=3104292 RepID=A0ABU5KQ44_9BACL|nr:FusB/FusC family EF-G-binding protein [Jeotgalibacillus sp. HH7-29]MDZ5713267.1 FusB/FusC family EF-G-binding protein [Jeotgalibacillus sp. HH7-29]